MSDLPELPAIAIWQALRPGEHASCVALLPRRSGFGKVETATLRAVTGRAGGRGQAGASTA